MVDTQMGWELRKGRFFYYRKVRVNGRVSSIYMGRGERAQEASRADGVALPDDVAQVEVPSIQHVQEEPSVEQTVETENAQTISPVTLNSLKYLERAVIAGDERLCKMWLGFDAVREALGHPSQRELAAKIKLRFPELDVSEDVAQPSDVG